MIQEQDQAVLTRPFPEYGLESGDIGTVVLVHRDGAAYEIEFTTLAGATIAVVTVTSDAVRPVGEREIAHAREVA